MASKPALSKILIILIAILALVTLGWYIRTWSAANLDFGRVMGRPPEKTTPDKESTDVKNKTDVSADQTDWITVKGDGYEFMHPDYFIKEENGYHIIAYEPVPASAEFSGLAIKQPFDTYDINVYMQDNIKNSQDNVGIKVTKEPQKISIDGFKSVYTYEYTLDSGPNTGAGKFFAFQSPYNDKWVTIEYAKNDNAEKIRKSFKFVSE